MFVNIDKWKEQHSYDLVLSQQIDMAPFHITIEVAQDYKHDWLFTRGELGPKHRKGALKNPYSTGPEDAYYYPAYKAHQRVKSLMEEYSIDETQALEKAKEQVQNEMYTALAPFHNGYSAYCILVTVRMRVNTPASTDLITLATRSKMGVEVEQLPTTIAANRAKAAELGLCEIPATPVTPAECELDAITVEAEKTVRRALDASIGIIRYFRYNTRMSDYSEILGKIAKSAVEVPLTQDEHMMEVLEMED